MYRLCDLCQEKGKKYLFSLHLLIKVLHLLTIKLLSND